MSSKLMRIDPIAEALSKDTGCSVETALSSLERHDWNYFSAKCWILENCLDRNRN